LSGGKEFYIQRAPPLFSAASGDVAMSYGQSRCADDVAVEVPLLSLRARSLHASPILGLHLPRSADPGGPAGRTPHYLQYIESGDQDSMRAGD
jgi:hypothetical protein